MTSLCGVDRGCGNAYAGAEAANAAAMAGRAHRTRPGAVGAPAERRRRDRRGQRRSECDGEAASRGNERYFGDGQQRNPDTSTKLRDRRCPEIRHAKLPGFTVSNAQVLSTPEGLYPLTGVKGLTIDASVSRGRHDPG